MRHAHSACFVKAVDKSAKTATCRKRIASAASLCLTNARNAAVRELTMKPPSSQSARAGERPCAICGHARDQHDIEQPYPCYGETRDGEQCECESFSIGGGSDGD